jgi:hypothetical protein
VNASRFTLDHPLGMTISSVMAESDAAARVATRPRDMRTGYVWYDLPVAIIAGDSVFMSLCFFEGRLSAIDLRVLDARFGSSWAEWSEENERARAEATRDWLERIGFPPAAYPWGEVWAGTDAKTGDGRGFIWFGNAHP